MENHGSISMRCTNCSGWRKEAKWLASSISANSLCRPARRRRTAWPARWGEDVPVALEDEESNVECSTVDPVIEAGSGREDLPGESPALAKGAELAERVHDPVLRS